jgi:hypothetical protein
MLLRNCMCVSVQECVHVCIACVGRDDVDIDAIKLGQIPCIA